MAIIYMNRSLLKAVAFSFLLLLILFHGASYSGGRIASQKQIPQLKSEIPHQHFKALNSSSSLLGPPAERFRDNLRNESHYITAWALAGLSNQFISHVNIIYLATLSDRIPIIPPFFPNEHISFRSTILPFGDLFDLPHLNSVLRIPILEWRDIKKLPSPDSENPYNTPIDEELGCWSTRPRTSELPVRAYNLMEHLGLDVSYTYIPSEMYREGNDQGGHVVFAELVSLIYPNHPLVENEKQPLRLASNRESERRPEDQLACFDFLYYATTGRHEFEWEKPWAPAWRAVGKHLRFTKKIDEAGKESLRRLFHVSPEENIPLFIAIHARRGDFIFQCGDMPGECLPPVSELNKMVEQIKAELIEKRGLEVHEVLITSDEKDPAFWREVDTLGWKYINHEIEKTAIKHGEWYPVFLDIVMHSFATGFLGTEASTYSLISKRRVEDWNNGVTMMARRGSYNLPT